MSGRIEITVDTDEASASVDKLRGRLHSLHRGFVWVGRHGRGAMAVRRDEKRAQAETRNGRTATHRRRAARR